MADINIFNTFSFKKWSERLRERKMEEEIQKQRMEQVIRLRNKLGRERALREQADMLNDEDIEHLIEYLNSGNSLLPPMNAAAAGAAGGKAAPGGAVAVQPAAPPINQMAMFGSVPKSDDYIMNELKAYSKKNGGISSVPETIFNYNRKYTEVLKERAAAAARNPRQIDADKLKLYKEFEYNRRYGNIV